MSDIPQILNRICRKFTFIWHNAQLRIHFIFSRLKTVLMGDQFEYLGMKAQLSVDFPESITLDQAIAVWKHVVLYQEKN